MEPAAFARQVRISRPGFCGSFSIARGHPKSKPFLPDTSLRVRAGNGATSTTPSPQPVGGQKASREQRTVAKAVGAVAADSGSSLRFDEEEAAAGNLRGDEVDILPRFLATNNGHHHISTLAVHGGERTGRPPMIDSITTPIVQTSTYFFRDTQELIAYQEGRHPSHEYGRYGNPTTCVVEQKISALEGAEETLLSASGMCSATTMLLALVPAGGHIVTTTDCYRRTRQFIQTLLPKMGITATVINPSDIKGLAEALDKHKVSLFFSESPTNPYMHVVDIPLVSSMCHAKGALVVIDGTFATPSNQRTIALGADLALQSATKYLAGHNDVLAGAVSGRHELIAQIRQLHNVLGGVVDPHAAYLILRGMKTLDLRVRQQNESALRLAKVLEKHPKIVRVHYPGLESHPGHDIAKRQMKGFGGVVSFEIDGDLMKTAKFIDALQLPYMAPSLGGVESLVEQPTIVSYWDVRPEDRAKLGIKDNLVRYSVGIEAFEDIRDDIFVALDSI